MEKRKLESDKKLIGILFGVDPLDWSRRDNGYLVFLNQEGQKFVVSPEELKALQDKKLKEHDHLTAHDHKIIDQEYEANSASPEQNQKPRSHHKKSAG